jgi:hypothetical protein
MTDLPYRHIGRCYGCDIEAKWVITRLGDVATGWACDDHLSAVSEDLQRDFEVTELKVQLWEKSVEWNQMAHSLNKIAGVPDVKHPHPWDTEW